jgi:hypothetical protein
VPESSGVLDAALSDPATESKFLALKKLNAKKVKTLMAQIDLNQSEIHDMKVQGKDNVRTRIIQGMKNKIAFEDTVLDYLKAEYAKQLSIPVVQLDDAVMRMTIGGPKRFRPMARADIEAKINETDRRIKLKSATSKVTDNSSVMGTNSTSRRRNAAAARIAEEVDGDGTGNSRAQKAILVKLSEDIKKSKQEVAIKAQKIDGLSRVLKNLKAKLTERNSDASANGNSTSGLIGNTPSPVSAIPPGAEVMRNSALKLQNALRDLGVAEEELLQAKLNAMMQDEQMQLEIDRLETLHADALRQHMVILRHMAELETQLDVVMHGGTGAIHSSLAKSAEAAALNSLAGPKGSVLSGDDYRLERCRSLQEQLDESQRACAALEPKAEEADRLRKLLRERNEDIREVRRSMQELARLEPFYKAGSASNEDMDDRDITIGSSDAGGSARRGYGVRNSARSGPVDIDDEEDEVLMLSPDAKRM